MNKVEEALEVHVELNPKLWEGMELKREVKDKLLEIAETFIEGLDYPINIADIRFLGSNASFNYNEHSDIDLHIISNFDLVYVDKDILQVLYNSSKNNFNNKHDISIYGIPVEIYIEDMNSLNATNGSYSLISDEWVKVPQPIDYEIPDYTDKLNDVVETINAVLESDYKAEVETMINTIYLNRKDGLATEGEASIGNCIFKELRNMGLIEKLRDKYYELESQELTLEGKKGEAIMDKLVEELVEEIQEPDKDDYMQKEEEYKEYIKTHIENVKKAYERIVKPLLQDEFTEEQFKALEDNLDIHDKDKSIPFMFNAYRKNHYPINDEEKEVSQEEYDIAWEYHKNINPHHWEYWLNSEKEPTAIADVEAVKLAYAEMFCDWLSFGFRKEATSATGESTEFAVWYGEAKQNIVIVPDLKEWFDDKIEKIMSFIEENKDTLYECKDVVTEGRSKLQEMEYKDYKSKVGFDLEYRVIAPIKEVQVDDTYDDFEVDIESLYDAYEDAQKQVLSLTSDEDWLKEIFPNVGLGRVYVGNVEIDEDKLDFDIGFSSVIDPVEEGNDIHLDENELKDQMVELAEGIIDNLDYLSVDQFKTVYSGDVDEDGDPIEDKYVDDDKVSFRLELDKDKTVKIELISAIVTESKKLEESSLSRVFSHYENTPFLVISAERTPNEGESEAQARQRNKINTLSLKNDIRSEGFGFIPVDGGWKEDGNLSYESSFFVPMSRGNFNEFEDWGIEMCDKYNQYAVLISDGQGNIAYRRQDGSVDMQFNNGVSFNGNTIDSNIDAAGVGGFTSLDKNKPNKRFQLQEDMEEIRYKSTSYGTSKLNHNYNKIVSLSEEDTGYDVLMKYKNADYGYINRSDLKFIIKTLYGVDVDLTQEVIDLEDCILTYKDSKITNIEKK